MKGFTKNLFKKSSLLVFEIGHVIVKISQKQSQMEFSEKVTKRTNPLVTSTKADLAISTKVDLANCTALKLTAV